MSPLATTPDLWPSPPEGPPPTFTAPGEPDSPARFAPPTGVRAVSGLLAAGSLGPPGSEVIEALKRAAQAAQGEYPPEYYLG